jgi:putative tricarboxylic transport membrane protein
LGSATDPGSGFIFFWCGLVMAFLSLTVLADSLREVGQEQHEFSDTNWPKLFLVLAALVLYGLLLEKLGFVLTTFALFSFLLWISEETKWPIVFTVAGAAALGSYALFELWLQVRLPKGIFGL